MEENYPCVHLSVGELLRAEQQKEDSPHRELIAQTLVAGKIVPVEISLALLQEAMKEKAAELGKETLFLVDGFPRNYDNLDGWCKYAAASTVLWSVLVYQCPLEVLEGRILERAKDSGRSDDNLESLRKRFRTFESDTMPVLDTLRDLGVVVDIAGNQPLDDVWRASQQVLNPLIRHDVLSANAALLESVESGDVEAYRKWSDPTWFEDRDATDVMTKQEGDATPTGDIDAASVEVITGREVAVSYSRVMQGEAMREKRIWSHQGSRGWRNVHFVRKPDSASP